LVLPHLDPQTTLCTVASIVHETAPSSHVRVAQTSPNAIGKPSGVVVLPHVTFVFHAVAPSVNHPSVTRRLPQIICRLQSGEPVRMPVARSRARLTAPFALTKPAPCVSGS